MGLIRNRIISRKAAGGLGPIEKGLLWVNSGPKVYPKLLPLCHSLQTSMQTRQLTDRKRKKLSDPDLVSFAATPDIEAISDRFVSEIRIKIVILCGDGGSRFDQRLRNDLAFERPPVALEF
jgi:hypothetical protein